jgi:hypothetical protein
MITGVNATATTACQTGTGSTTISFRPLANTASTSAFMIGATIPVTNSLERRGRRFLGLCALRSLLLRVSLEKTRRAAPAAPAGLGARSLARSLYGGGCRGTPLRTVSKLVEIEACSLSVDGRVDLVQIASSACRTSLA